MSVVLYKLRFWDNKRYVETEDCDAEMFFRNEQDQRMCWKTREDAILMKTAIEKQYSRIGIHPPEICLEVFCTESQESNVYRLPYDYWP